jgi:hypothetical protein
LPNWAVLVILIQLWPYFDNTAKLVEYTSSAAWAGLVRRPSMTRDLGGQGMTPTRDAHRRTTVTKNGELSAGFGCYDATDGGAGFGRGRMAVGTCTAIC